MLDNSPGGTHRVEEMVRFALGIRTTDFLRLDNNCRRLSVWDRSRPEATGPDIVL
jgi:hypothetical protein